MRMNLNLWCFSRDNLIIKTYSKKLSEHVAGFDYRDKILIVRIISSVSVVGARIVIAGASSTSFFSLTAGIIKTVLSIARNKKRKQDKILMLAKSKLNSIETLASQALIDMKISHEEFITTLQEKK